MNERPPDTAIAATPPCALPPPLSMLRRRNLGYGCAVYETPWSGGVSGLSWALLSALVLPANLTCLFALLFHRSSFDLGMQLFLGLFGAVLGIPVTLAIVAGPPLRWLSYVRSCLRLGLSPVGFHRVHAREGFVLLQNGEVALQLDPRGRRLTLRCASGRWSFALQRDDGSEVGMFTDLPGPDALHLRDALGALGFTFAFER